MAKSERRLHASKDPVMIAKSLNESITSILKGRDAVQLTWVNGPLPQGRWFIKLSYWPSHPLSQEAPLTRKVSMSRARVTELIRNRSQLKTLLDGQLIWLMRESFFGEVTRG